MSSVETVSALERRLSASIPQQTIQGEVLVRLKSLGRKAKIAGFRPGKIPTKILEQYYGAQARHEALNDVLYRSFAEAAETNSLKVAGNPRFEITTKDMDAEQIEYSATFEVYPEVVLDDLSTQAVDRLSYELDQVDVDNTIATLRKQRVTFEKTDRQAQNEDQVYIDFTGTLNGVVFQGGEAKDYPFVLGVGRMLPEFEAAVVGMRTGDTKSFDMIFPESYHSKDVAGKQVTFSITLNRVEAPKLPELDSKFVKSVGIADGDVNKLESEIRSNLAREIERRLKVRNKDAAMNALLTVAKFNVPKSLVETEVRSLMQQTIKDMESRGVKMKDVPISPDLFIERAEKRVKLGLILSELVEKHGLKANPNQLMALISDYAQSFDQPEDVVRWYASDAARMREVENLALEENVVAWVMGQAKVTEKIAVFNELMGDA